MGPNEGRRQSFWRLELKKLFISCLIYGAIFGFSNFTFAESVEIPSCGSAYAITIKSDKVFVRLRSREQQKNYSLQLPFHAGGGAIAASGKFFIIYGTPFVIDRRNPQASEFLVYEGFSKPKIIHKGKVGGGIFDAGFSQDEKYMVMDEKSGTLMFNLLTRTEKLLDDFAPGPPTQQCEAP